MFKKKTLGTIAVIMSCAIVFTACVSKTSKQKASNNTLITMILDKGGVNDGSFNESAYKGAIKAKEELGVEVKYLESHTDTDYYANIETAIDMESDLIIAVGYNLSQAVETAAKNYPEQKFAIIDGSFGKIPTNVTSIVFNEEEAGYLAGLATAKAIPANNFGFIGGLKVPAVERYRDGFEMGLQKVNPNAILATQYANSFTDAAKGRAISAQMFANDSGIEVIMTAAGSVNSGVYEVAKEYGKYAVAVDMAQSSVAPDVIITSALKNVDTGVYSTIKSLTNNTLKQGCEVVYNILNDGVGYEKTKFISDETVEFINNSIMK